MVRIVPGIRSVEQYAKQLHGDPETYRPNCQKFGLNRRKLP